MKNILHSLQKSSMESGENGFHMMKNGIVIEKLSYKDLYRYSCNPPQSLKNSIFKNERIGLIYLNELDFIKAFFSIIFSGGVPVPIAPPQNFSPLASFIKRTSLIAEQSNIKTFFTSEAIADDIRLVAGSEFNIKTLKEFDYAVTEINTEIDFKEESANSTIEVLDDTAFIQYTSGSTSSPKGVVVSHKNLITNVLSMRDSFYMNKGTPGVTWLPFYHDMGLIGGLLLPISCGANAYIMKTAEFIKNPFLWLKAISDFKLNISPAPNFAYSFCVSRVDETKIKDLDLSSWRFATTGSEPINPNVMREFTKKFLVAGFDCKAIMPLYGMAEATLGVTFSGANEGMSSIFIDRVLLGKGLVVKTEKTDINAKEVVSCGKPIKGVDVSIFHNKTHTIDSFQLGEICMKGISICASYDNDLENTHKMHKNGWFFSGDIGFLVNGRLYIVGRTKEVIIINGSNYYANDIEHYAQEVLGVSLAVAIPLIDQELEGCSLIVVPGKKVEQEPLASMVRQNISEELGINIVDIVFCASGKIPKTTSGKIDRKKVLELYADLAEYEIGHSLEEALVN